MNFKINTSLSKILKHLKIPTQQIQLARKVGIANCIKYKFAKNNECVPLKLKDHLVWVRKGTPDLEVAISCLIDGEFSSIAKHLNRSFNGVIVDAGGYIGTAALALSEMFPHAQVISVEPSKANIKILEKNVSSNKNIRIVYGALVGKDLDVVTLKNRGTGEWGFTAVEKPCDNEAAQVMHETPAFTLKKLGIDPSNIGILKLDIEGGEFDLFTNDMNALKQVRVVVAELHDRIVTGCSEAFNRFSKDRFVFKDDAEKYFSIRRS